MVMVMVMVKLLSWQGNFWQVRQMDLEENVDVFYWFKCVHLCRPGVWVSLVSFRVREKYQVHVKLDSRMSVWNTFYWMADRLKETSLVLVLFIEQCWINGCRWVRTIFCFSIVWWRNFVGSRGLWPKIFHPALRSISDQVRSISDHLIGTSAKWSIPN